MSRSIRSQAQLDTYKIPTRKFHVPTDGSGKELKVSEYYGENVFDYTKSDHLTKADKNEMAEVISSKGTMTKELANKVANAVTAWAIDRGATHFTHWFQPLTGSTAEKHDAFLSIEDGLPVEKLSASQLIQGEPDASSFPNGGSRSTFEARGYTSWDITSPMFLKSSENGKTLCIPTAFVTYHGEALDIKTPLLRSITALSKSTTTFLNLINGSNRDGDKVTHVDINCGCEQEYFLIDKGLYYERPDLVMTGRTLFGAATSRNQQLDDHYFGTVPDRVLAFMQEVEVELYKLGVPAKTRHNEVAPGQFELAPIFGAANVATDHNQLVMAVLQSVAIKHDFVCLLHEKPFAEINGSGKHINWSMSDSNGNNLLEPTAHPQTNYQFLALTAMIVESINRHAGVLRTSIASHGNDHRLGANEAPPSIISVFLGDTLTKIFEAYASGKDYTAQERELMDLGAEQLTDLLKDNTDRNRTSPFAFTGNRFEFRAVGSSQNVGIPMTILNSAVADVMNDMNVKIEADIKAGKSVDDALMNVIKDLYNNSSQVVFNGDGYSQEWVVEAEKRGLPNLRTTADALTMLNDDSANDFLLNLGVYSKNEIQTRYNVRVERYNKHRMIEFDALTSIIHKDVFPAAIAYKNNLAKAIDNQDEVGVKAEVEIALLNALNTEITALYKNASALSSLVEAIRGQEEEAATSSKIAKELLPLSEKVADSINKIEESVSDDIWGLPTYYEMLFVK